MMVWINNHRHPLLDQFFTAVTWAGSLAALLPLSMLVLGFLLYRGKAADAWLLGVGFGGAVLLAHLLKMVFGRPRPSLAPVLVPMPTDFSFPSAHMAQVTAFCLCLLIIFCRNQPGAIGVLFVILAAMLVGSVGYSRLYLQVHFVSDVAAGFLFSAVWVTAAAFVIARLYR